MDAVGVTNSNFGPLGSEHFQRDSDSKCF